MTPTALRPVYAVAGREITVRNGPVALPPTASEIFDGSARLGTRECRVRSLAMPDRDLLQVSGAGTFAILRGQDRIEVDPEPGVEESALVEALLGPALALSLARKGIFVLHASAVVLSGGVFGFMGESGAGKSTLARLLAAEGLARAADDLLAVTEAPAALPHFPQLKLDEAAMAAIAGLQPSYPLLGLYGLEPAPPDAKVSSEALPAASAAALLIQHTIAGRLFARDLLADHLGFAAATAGRVPIRRLAVPRRLDVGAEVLRHLPKPSANA